jgi:chromosome segregation ATPase
VDLVRGSALYFLTEENQDVASKLGAMNTQLGEVELELNGLKDVLYKSESQVARNKFELESLQQKYDFTQIEIETIQQENAKEEHALLIARLSSPTEDSAARVRMRSLHDSLSHAEVKLSQAMEELKEEQRATWSLEEESAKEESLTSHVNAKIKLAEQEIEKFGTNLCGMAAIEAERRKKMREIEMELDELMMNDMKVTPDHLVPQKMAEDAANELAGLREQLEAMAKELQEKSNAHQLAVERGHTLEKSLERQQLVLEDYSKVHAMLQHQSGIRHLKLQHDISIFDIYEGSDLIKLCPEEGAMRAHDAFTQLRNESEKRAHQKAEVRSFCNGACHHSFLYIRTVLTIFAKKSCSRTFKCVC